MLDVLLRWFGLDVPLPFGRAPGWSAVRAAHLRVQPCCQFCGTRQGLEVHHVVPVSVDPERELDAANLITLCGPDGPHNCHLLIGHMGSTRRHNSDVRLDCWDWQERRRDCEEAP